MPPVPEIITIEKLHALLDAAQSIEQDPSALRVELAIGERHRAGIRVTYEQAITLREQGYVTAMLEDEGMEEFYHAVEHPPCVVTDAGRIHGETKDCTVRAFTVATGLPYPHVHEVFTRAGRIPRTGFSLPENAYEVATMLGYHAEPLIEGDTLAAVLALYPSGRYVARVSGHAFAIVDGVVHDYWPQSANRRILGLWRIQKQARRIR